MREVHLNGQVAGGRSALVDEEDYELVSSATWCAVHGRRDTLYAKGYIKGSYSEGKPRYVYMHQLLTGFSRTDHRNHDGLDNRRSNLFAVTAGENQQNRRPNVKSLSLYKGVCRDSNGKFWRAQISLNGVRMQKQGFATQEEAAIQYDIWARELYGDRAVVNFP